MFTCDKRPAGTKKVLINSNDVNMTVYHQGKACRRGVQVLKLWFGIPAM